MSQPTLYVAITNHGFGHAARTASVVATIQELFPELQLIVVTKAPRWLLELYIQGDFIYRCRGFDVGVVQADSMTMDKRATLEKLHQILAQQQSLVEEEVNFIRQNQVDLILADIPPLAAVIAKKAEIPCWMTGNFGWDFIYRAWGNEFIEIVEWISECFSQCTHLFRQPFHESMSAFQVITDIGLTGGKPRYHEEELRASWGITAPVAQTVLINFGGFAQQIPYNNITSYPDWQFITYDRDAPDLPNLIKVNAHRYRPVDFMPLCGQVISKPGYGTFAEAVRVGVPIVSVTREDFAESALLLEGIANHAYHQILSPIELFQGNWEFLNQPFQPPRQLQRIATDGNEALAQAVVNYFQNYV
jgi:hypothetical protein